MTGLEDKQISGSTDATGAVRITIGPTAANSYSFRWVAAVAGTEGLLDPPEGNRAARRAAAARARRERKRSHCGGARG